MAVSIYNNAQAPFPIPEKYGAGVMNPGQVISVRGTANQVQQDFAYNALLQFGSVPDSESDLIGVNNGPSQLVTTASIALFVDPVNGSDLNNGLTSDKPKKTIQAALDYIPLVVRHACTITLVGTGAINIPETLFDNHVYGVNGTFTGTITIIGGNLLTPTLTSGSLTGTLGNAPATGITRTATIGVNWTAHNLKGKFIKITSGGLAGRLYPIADNGTNTIDIPSPSATLNGATFAIVTLGFTLTKGTGLNMSIMAASSGGSTGSAGLIVQQLNVVSSSFYGMYVGSGNAELLECYVDAGSFIGVNLLQDAANVVIQRTYIQGNSTTRCISGNEASELTVGAVVCDGGTNGVRFDGILGHLNFSSSGHLVVQNCTGTGIDFRYGPLGCETFTAEHIICRANAIGMALDSQAHMLMQGCEFTANTSHGIQVRGGNAALSHNGLYFVSCLITGNGGDGVRVENSHNALLFQGTTISTNVGVGVDFISVAGAMPSTYNSAYFDSACVMSGNGNDLSIDGTNFQSIATLRGATPALDATVTFNRLGAQ